jgi:chromosome segregation protein
VRLNQVKLAGFKSFVDPTVFQLPSQLVGVVGPNGCGKSNIIDAVRWVLGESKASELRGESMQDVIFNGTSQRKPSSRASVELVFNNDLGRAGGQWSQFSEIAVKRVLTRDGTSNYYINNQVVRRRDVQDMFMGTGLGPRAYAIIGQGMINRIIESKPEELRVFLEEAAGVSKYKERRRETEHRLHDTRENLNRVLDVVQELDGQITKLSKQAEVASQFTALKTQTHSDQVLLAFLRQQEASKERIALALQTETVQTQVDAALAQLRAKEADIVHIRGQQYAANDAVQTAQTTVFTAASQVAHLEADMRLHSERRHRLEAELKRQEQEKTAWHVRCQESQALQIIQQARLDDLAVALDDQTGSLEELTVHTDTLLSAQIQAQDALDHARLNSNETDKNRRALLAERGVLDNNYRTSLLALSQSKQAKINLTQPDSTQLNQLKIALTDSQAQQETLQALLEEANDAHATANDALDAARALDTQHRGQVQRLEARQSSLEKLQHDMHAASKIHSWLDTHGFGKHAQFWQQLRVKQGWDTAVQAVLRHRAQALCLSGQADDAALFKRLLDDHKRYQVAPPAAVTMIGFDTQSVHAKSWNLDNPLAEPKLIPLLSQMTLHDAASDLWGVAHCWLANIYCADSVSDALVLREQLPLGGLFVTREGHRVDAVSVQWFAPETLEDNALVRQQALEDLALTLAIEQTQAIEAMTQLQHCLLELQQAAHNKERYSKELQQLGQSTHQCELGVLQLQQAITQFEMRNTQLQASENELLLQCNALDERLAQLDDALARTDEDAAHTQRLFDTAREVLTQAQAALSAHQQREANGNKSLQELHYQQRSAQDRLQDAQRTCVFASDHVAKAHNAMMQAEQDLQDLGVLGGNVDLQAAIAQRLAAEKALAHERTTLETLNHTLRQQDELRMQIDRSIEPLRIAVMDLQLKEQAARLALEQFTDQLLALNASGKSSEQLAQLPSLYAQNSLPKPATVLARINGLQRDIDALGAVNLAALDELTQSQNRQAFLNSQMQDLQLAMTTLEEAIRTIDRETRAMLKSTFDQVNHHFGLLFPQLFGGGEARLIMTGEEILDAGLQVLAHPPGKRNSSIHLLSGGEKALTATALVFAIFQLNPAPFCLLDEVDAPLDDSNTERFANMVASMSKQTQFVFISHNKIAMEMAQQLIGVTMQEQGVSRIVSVDMESAAQFVT